MKLKVKKSKNPKQKCSLTLKTADKSDLVSTITVYMQVTL